MKNEFDLVIVDGLMFNMVNHEDVPQYAPGHHYKFISTVVNKSKLRLSMTDDGIDYLKVTVPSIVSIGGRNTRSAEQLTGDVGMLADWAKEGPIIVPFGSQFVLPLRVLKVFAEAFLVLPQSIIIWHTRQKLPNLPQNLHLESWMPQNNILGHLNSWLFIMHCSLYK